MAESFSDEETALWAREGVCHRHPNGSVLGIGGGILPCEPRGVSIPRLRLIHAMGSLWNLPLPGLALHLAVAFFKASPSIVTNLRPQYIPRWAGLGRSLYKGTWKSSTLAARFFEVSPDLVRNLPFWDVEVFASLIEALSYKSYDVAAECLVLGRDVLPVHGTRTRGFPVHVSRPDRQQLAGS